MAESSLDSLRQTRDARVEWRAYELRPAGSEVLPPEVEAVHRQATGTCCHVGIRRGERSLSCGVCAERSGLDRLRGSKVSSSRDL